MSLLKKLHTSALQPLKQGSHTRTHTWFLLHDGRAVGSVIRTGGIAATRQTRVDMQVPYLSLRLFFFFFLSFFFLFFLRFGSSSASEDAAGALRFEPAFELEAPASLFFPSLYSATAT